MGVHAAIPRLIAGIGSLADVGKDGGSVYDITSSDGNDHRRIDNRFALEENDEQYICVTQGTYIEGVKDLIDIQPPCSDPAFILLRAEKARDHIPFALLDDIPLDPAHDTACESSLMSESSRAFTAGITYIVNRSIFSDTDLVTSSPLLLSIPRSRAIQTSAQASPSSTQSNLLIIESCIH